MIPSILAQEWQAATLEYLDTVFPFREDRVSEKFMEFLRDPERGLFKGPYVHARLPYKQVGEYYESPLTAITPDFLPYEHQLRAFYRLNSAQIGGPKPTLVTTGTGSGKTESFLYPILDHCLRMRRDGRQGIKAIIIYPMNALAQDQAKRLAKLIYSHPEASRTLTAGLYVGHGDNETGGAGANVSQRMTETTLIEDRKLLRRYPPDILLTNYKMLDLLLQRKSDLSLWAQNKSDTLQYLVLDELHTYDGVQSTDVACLIRRLKARLNMAPDSICAVGTSATLGDGSGQAMENLLQFARTVFAAVFDADAIITEIRPPMQEFLLDISDESTPAWSDELLPQPSETAEEYSERQIQIWFGGEYGREELGKRLRSHPWFHHLCRTATQQSIPWQELLEHFAKEFNDPKCPDDIEPFLVSFLAIVSFALWDNRRPLMPIQVQFWMREMRGLLRELDEIPKFRWNDKQTEHFFDGNTPDYVADPRKAALPMTVCLACGVGGWIALRDEEEQQLEGNPSMIGALIAQVRGRHTPKEVKESLCYLFPSSCGSPSEGANYLKYVNKTSAKITDRADENSIRVHMVVPYATKQAGLGSVSALEGGCPYCGANEAMIFVSMQRASMGAVIVGHTIGSERIEDRKVLAFTDSVQDSALLAGFIEHRTKSMRLRAGIRQMLDSGYQGERLSKLLQDWQFYWREKFGDDTYVRAFVERDEDDEHFRQLLPESVSEWTDEHWETAKEHVTWRVVRELGLHARLGRSLYLTGAAAWSIDEERVAQAVQQAALTVREMHPQLDSDGLLEERISRFVWGITHRMVLFGGISHPLLESYRENAGNGYFLTKRRNPLYDGSKRRPQFFAEGKTTEGLVSLYGSANGWFSRYVKYSLQPDFADQLQHSIETGVIGSVLFEAMKDAQLLDVRFCRQDRTYGLRPDALFLHTDTARLQCRECGAELTVADQDKSVFDDEVLCLAHLCVGTYRVVNHRKSKYYTRIYQEVRVEPVVAKEHSSLIPMEERKEIETRFADGGESPVNVLVCTPTMEMGIDIGDLSTVLLSSVPPSVSNQLQRVGRAGRSTGTALIAQIVRNTPHDQYFWQLPFELLAGRVESPYCPLDAPEVLKRHLCAYLLDSWVREKTEAEIPIHAYKVVAEEAMQGFPHLWYAFVDVNQSRLWNVFRSLFAGHIQEYSLGLLQKFLFDGDWKDGIRQVIHERREEQKEAKNHLERLNKRLQDPLYQIQDQQSITEEHKELRRAHAQAKRRQQELMREHTLQWWTTEGLLPNYTFPESGVTLKRYKQHSWQDVRVEKFVRPSKSALREFAPGNSFYARGRHTVLNQIPMVRKDKDLETWRLCPVCQHMEKDDGSAVGVCPQCGSPSWQDQGQVSQMVRLRQVASRPKPKEDTRITDDQEERERMRSLVYPMFRFHDRPTIGYAMRRQVFGYEFFERTTVREINFGVKHPGEPERKVGHKSVPRNGFTICEKCGGTAVLDQQGKWTVQHVRGYGCDRNRTRRDIGEQLVALGSNEQVVNAAESEIHVYFYRELQSEALRIALPIGEALVENRVATWRAILLLGLRELIGGSAQQMEIESYDEPLPGHASMRGHYLVIYDQVPGGTGYLRQIAENGKLSTLLQAAYERIRDCRCQQEGRDGCYRCLLRYETQFNHDLISRRDALNMLKPIVQESGEWERVAQLSWDHADARRALVESDLEALAEEALIACLARKIPDSKRLEQSRFQQGALTGVELSWEAEEGKRGWRLVRQQSLIGHEGVPIETRPDWVLWPLHDSEEIQPVAVYCDGAEYHIGQGEFDRLPHDIVVREGIRRGGEFAVFTLTWRDVQLQHSELESVHGTDPRDDFSQTLTQVANRMATRIGGVQDPNGLWRRSALDLLVEYLLDPKVTRWRTQAELVALAAAGVDAPDKVAFEDAGQAMRLALMPERHDSYLHAAREQDGPKSGNSITFREYRFGPRNLLSLVLTAKPRNSALIIHGVLRLNDEERGLHEEEFKQAWQAFLHWHNATQWLRNMRFVTASSLRTEADWWNLLEVMYPTADEQSVAQVDEEETPLADFAPLINLVHPSHRLLLVAMLEAGIPQPEIGYEFVDGGQIAGEAELVWPDRQICVLRGAQIDDQEAIEQLGWQVWDLTAFATDERQDHGADWMSLWNEMVEGRK